jgi:hypothetical protein
MWIEYVKPVSRRKGNYLAHLRTVLAGLQENNIPATNGNIRRLGCGRGPRTRAALAELAAEAVGETAEDTIDSQQINLPENGSI